MLRTGGPWPHYNGAGEKGWVVGETREVTDVVADYLEDTFPGCWEPAGPRSVVADAPAKDRVVRSPKPRAATVKSGTTKKKAPKRVKKASK